MQQVETVLDQGGTDAYLPEALQRTLIVTCDEGGAVVGCLLEEILREWGSPPVARVLSMEVGAGEIRPDDPVGDAVLQRLDEALLDISRLSHRPALRHLGFRLDRLGELVIWVVGTSEVHVAAAARAAAARAGGLLAVDPMTMGVVMRDVEQRGTALAHDAGGERVQAVSPLASETLAAFTGPCYLVTLLNEAGLALDGPAELYQRVARFLALHTCTRLRDIPAWLSESEPWAAPAQSCPSFGLAWVAWPGSVARARAVELLKVPVLAALVARSPVPDARPELEAVAPPPALVVDPLTPPDLVGAVYQAASQMPPVTLFDVLQPPQPQACHPLLARWQETEATCAALVVASDVLWDACLTALVDERLAQLRTGLWQILDAHGAGAAQSALVGLRARIDDWIASVETRSEELEVSVERTEAQAGALWQALETLLGRMPRRRFWHLLRLAFRPFTLMWIFRQWRRIAEEHQRYLHLRAALLSARVSQRQMRQAQVFYAALSAAIQDLAQVLDDLAAGVRSGLAPAPDVPEWPAGCLLLPPDPDRVLEALISGLVPPPATLTMQLVAALGPLSRWAQEGVPDAGELVGPLWAAAEPLLHVPIVEVLRQRFAEHADASTWLHEVDVQAVPFWRWEPAVLSEADRPGLGLLRLALMAPDLAAWMPDGHAAGSGPGQEHLVPFALGDRMALVNLRRGVPAR